ncbi:MOSC domain-containing protein [Sulfurimonas sp. C5]|uniref:MOSC domain-containing protein n=1 Tax=Sulfurimonas sp. C5 TaxID=3036947 RepID=UPI0024542C76|nr:MOSC domain-containing protein [Sulfurimonas sp. C5]MDH4945424.1 MOSC domain-containing protein [Sulfurimonas sp. C5]
MKTGKVLKLFTTCNDEKKTRISPESINVDNEGVLEDKFHGKDLLRSVLIASVYSYELAKKEGIDIEYGLLGENILVDINPYSLLPGQQLQIGETTLEITQNCTLCKGLSSVDSKLPKVLKTDRGIFAKVVSGRSVIKIGDVITI